MNNTRPRYDNHSTEFGLWVRKQDELDSRTNLLSLTNIDYAVTRKIEGNSYIMFIEEKRYNGKIKWHQRNAFDIIHKAMMSYEYYRGFHTLIFEKTSPEDGAIYLNGKEISTNELISFIKFEGDEKLYN